MIGIKSFALASMSDPRFAKFKTDPRFRPLKKHKSKVVVDDRFKSVFDKTKEKKKGASQHEQGTG